MAEILVVDDERSICLAFEQLLAGSRHRCRTVSSVRGAMQAIEEMPLPDIVFMDVRLPDGDGIRAAARVCEMVPHAKIVIMTAFGSVNVAVSAMQQGAFDYLPKPLDLSKIREVLDRALASEGPSALVALDDFPEEEGPLIGRSKAIQEIFKLIGIVSQNDVPVLIEGESGVGKELVARAIHEASSRCEEPFVAINCSAIPVALFESELFGHDKGAFTGAHKCRSGRLEAAGRGTVFFDEIGDMPPEVQVKVLRTLQGRMFERVGSTAEVALNARIVAATHHDLQEDVSEGCFREDLLYRLKVVTIKVPPLRERAGDIGLLSAHFIRRANTDHGTRIRFVERSVLDRLERASWPGNVRELENVIRSACVRARSETLLSGYLEIAEPDCGVAEDSADALVETKVYEVLKNCLCRGEQPEEGLYWGLIKAAERGALRAALGAVQGNQVAAARALGIGRGTLRRKLGEYGLRDASQEGGEEDAPS